MDRRAFLLTAAALPISFAYGSGARAGGIPDRPFALVTADLDAHVAAVDLANGRVLGRIPTQRGPRSIEALDGGGALVAHTELGRVTLIDASSFRVRSVIVGFREPRYTAAFGDHAYVTDSARGEVVTLNSKRGTVVSRASVPGPARHVTITPDGELIWTALGSKAREVSVLDASVPRRLRPVRTLSTPFLAHDVVAAPDGQHIWVTSGDSRRLAVYHRSGRRPLDVLAAGAPPQHIAFVRDLAFVASGDDGTVRVHRLDGTVVRQVQVPIGSYNVSFGDRWAITPSLSRGTVAVLDPHGRIRAVRPVARAAHDACIVVDS